MFREGQRGQTQLWFPFHLEGFRRLGQAASEARYCTVRVLFGCGAHAGGHHRGHLPPLGLLSRTALDRGTPEAGLWSDCGLAYDCRCLPRSARTLVNHNSKPPSQERTCDELIDELIVLLVGWCVGYLASQKSFGLMLRSVG